MHNLLGPQTIVGYCTNVHAGHTLDQTLSNLGRYTLGVKQHVCPKEPLGVGLWLSAAAARQIIDENCIDPLADWLNDHGLIVFTLNGFPFGDFHEPTVKHRVYQPDWSDDRRLQYTLDLIRILSHLHTRQSRLTEITEASISTLPIRWGSSISSDPYDLQPVTNHLLAIVEHLERLEQQTGRLLHLDLEPEPGCLLQTSQDVVTFFESHLDPFGDPQCIRRYLRLCHDICHAAVMFEDPCTMFERYEKAGIRIGKVQISSAIHVPLSRLRGPDSHRALHQLTDFAEDRYLHQTTIQAARRATSPSFFEDLPPAIEGYLNEPIDTGDWRVHFHLPLFLERVGLLETTQHEVVQCLNQCRRNPDIRHYEIETYAWNVLPESTGCWDLTEGIVREFDWLKSYAMT